MPYIVTVTQPRRTVWEGVRSSVVTEPPPVRTAVATLEEARNHVHSLGADYGAMAHLDCVLDGTSRMPVGPLPDGTVIRVRSVEWIELARLCGMDCGSLCAGPNEDVLAAFNARCGALGPVQTAIAVRDGETIVETVGTPENGREAHESARLFVPVDVPAGQMSLEGVS